MKLRLKVCNYAEGTRVMSQKMALQSCARSESDNFVKSCAYVTTYFGTPYNQFIYLKMCESRSRRRRISSLSLMICPPCRELLVLIPSGFPTSYSSSASSPIVFSSSASVFTSTFAGLLGSTFVESVRSLPMSIIPVSFDDVLLSFFATKMIPE